MNRPAVPAHRIPAHQRAREKLILGSNQDRIAFRLPLPIVVDGAAEQRMDAEISIEPEVLPPRERRTLRLLDQRSHGQTEHEPPASLSALFRRAMPSTPQPTENSSGRLARARGR